MDSEHTTPDPSGAISRSIPRPCRCSGEAENRADRIRPTVALTAPLRAGFPFPAARIDRAASQRRQANMSSTDRVDQREAAQREAIDAVVRALELPARSLVPERGLRTQVIMATGSGKTRVAVRSAEELRAGRVLVLVPSLDLLA